MPTILNAGRTILSAGRDAIKYITNNHNTINVSGGAVLGLCLLVVIGNLISIRDIRRQPPIDVSPRVTPSSTTSPPVIPPPEIGPITVKNTSEQNGQSWWNWTVFIDSDPQTLSQIDCVQYTLHPTFPQPIQKVCTNQNNFALTGSGYGSFDIQVRVFLKDGTVRDLPPYWLQGVGQ